MRAISMSSLKTIREFDRKIARVNLNRTRKHSNPAELFSRHKFQDFSGSVSWTEMCLCTPTARRSRDVDSEDAGSRERIILKFEL